MGTFLRKKKWCEGSQINAAVIMQNVPLSTVCKLVFKAKKVQVCNLFHYRDSQRYLTCESFNSTATRFKDIFEKGCERCFCFTRMRGKNQNHKSNVLHVLYIGGGQLYSQINTEAYMAIYRQCLV